MEYIIVFIIGYFLGCIQTGYIVGKLIFKKDIRTLGNGNAGASNAIMVFGKKFGILTGIVDIFKGILAILIVRMIFDGVIDSHLINLIYITGMSVILGHNFPFYMNFKGGKGTASNIGVLFGIDYRLGLVAVLLMVIIILIVDYMPIATIGLLIVMVVYTAIFHFSIPTMFVSLALSAMSIFKHRVNFINIKKGQEKRVLSVLKLRP